MKTIKIFSTFALILTLLLTSASCKKRKSLSELRREEREAVAQFIKEKELNILHELPTDTIFVNEKDFYLNSSSGLYLHVADKGDAIPPREGELVTVRFYEMTLQGDTTTRAMEPNQLSFAVEFRYGSETAIVPAFNEAASYMGHEGEAFLIVPSAIGHSTAQQNITPFYYHIRTKIQ